MEKLAFVVWKRGGESDQEFAERLRGDVATGLRQRGARYLTISAVDDDVARGAGIRIGRDDPPKSGLVTFWVDQAQERGDLEETLRGACGAVAGYLVLESRPLTPTAQIAAPGERTPGRSGVRRGLATVRRRADPPPRSPRWHGPPRPPAPTPSPSG